MGHLNFELGLEIAVVSYIAPCSRRGRYELAVCEETHKQKREEGGQRSDGKQLKPKVLKGGRGKDCLPA
jgi:hypothetical protein